MRPMGNPDLARRIRLAIEARRFGGPEASLWNEGKKMANLKQMKSLAQSVLGEERPAARSIRTEAKVDYKGFDVVRDVERFGLMRGEERTLSDGEIDELNKGIGQMVEAAKTVLRILNLGRERFAKSLILSK